MMGIALILVGCEAGSRTPEAMFAIENPEGKCVQLTNERKIKINDQGLVEVFDCLEIR